MNLYKVKMAKRGFVFDSYRYVVASSIYDIERIIAKEMEGWEVVEAVYVGGNVLVQDLYK